jgi:CheY-like chemotaxis protein
MIIAIRNFKISLAKEVSVMKTIFFADDSATQRTITAEFLSKKGFSVKVFEDGQTMLNELNYDQPEVIILDVVMPNMNGFQVCRELKKDPRTKNIPIIISESESLNVRQSQWKITQPPLKTNINSKIEDYLYSSITSLIWVDDDQSNLSRVKQEFGNFVNQSFLSERVKNQMLSLLDSSKWQKLIS